MEGFYDAVSGWKRRYADWVISNSTVSVLAILNQNTKLPLQTVGVIDNHELYEYKFRSFAVFFVSFKTPTPSFYLATLY